MRRKRAKQYKKAMALYNTYFGFREPLQVLGKLGADQQRLIAVILIIIILVDGTFLHQAHAYRMDVEHYLRRTLMSDIKLCKSLGRPPSSIIHHMILIHFCFCL